MTSRASLYTRKKVAKEQAYYKYGISLDDINKYLLLATKDFDSDNTLVPHDGNENVTVAKDLDTLQLNTVIPSVNNDLDETNSMADSEEPHE
ncbi:unnamed protein product [Didymodactylos carnosus]|uniref:Uncharacterized protein n=1 Tax=Didymodactylos carnosus TaxID=1234261 RepID=A0A814SUQ8_9BILA|nr:unnamed protein product [Didymodactylos carnosus]CAF1152790.1 unnamed protein product [Didymodactylos carnosus]CAF3815963.1 unnamed protein product [Didymodactylos carnosus]CAF3916285.1 unnamed protein product [Didymodactylos carnosus]